MVKAKIDAPKISMKVYDTNDVKDTFTSEKKHFEIVAKLRSICPINFYPSQRVFSREPLLSKAYCLHRGDGRLDVWLFN